jgi:hypothetical protein
MGGSSTIGSNGGQSGVYGTLETPASGNIPGGRASAASWTDSSGNLWLFGGRGFDVNGNYGELNDLWVYQPLATISPASTTTTLASSQNTSVYGQAVTFTANVTSSVGAPPNGETVTFMNGTTTLGTGTLSRGTASFTTSALSVGAYSITAVYSSDSNFAGSTSTAVSQTVGQANSSSTLTSSPNPSSFAGSVTFTATVSGQFGGAATGTVTFSNGSVTLGTGTLSGGTASLASTALPVGKDSITAVYSGDSNFFGITSNTVSQVVTAIPAAAPTFSPAGGTFTTAQTVTLSTATGGASINYTTDGSAPSDTAGTLYTGPITVSSTITIKAVAFASGLSDSTVSTAAYKIGN